MKSRYSYHQRIPTDLQTLVFDALVKYDHESGAREVYEYPKGWYPNEAPFAKSTRGGAEDRGYVITLATHARTTRRRRGSSTRSASPADPLLE